MARFHATCEWFRLDSGTVAVGTRGTTASLGPIARLAEVPLECGY